MVALYIPFSGVLVSSVTVPLVLSTPVVASVRLLPSNVLSLMRVPLLGVLVGVAVAVLVGVVVGVAVGPLVAVAVGVLVGVFVGVAVAPPLPDGPGIAAVSLVVLT